MSRASTRKGAASVTRPNLGNLQIGISRHVASATNISPEETFAPKPLDAGIETAAVAAPAAAVEPEAKPAKRRAKAEAPAAKPVTVPAGLADKPRIKKGAQIRADGLEEGGPDAILVDAVKQPGGALHSDLCQLVGGWKKCDRRLAHAAALVGLRLKSKREGSDTRFEVA